MTVRRNQQTRKKSTTDPINPQHYTKHKVQPVEVMEIFFTSGKPCDMHLSHAFKYAARAGDKIEAGETDTAAYERDLKKALWWMQRALAHLNTKE